MTSIVLGSLHEFMEWYKKKKKKKDLVTFPI